MKIALSLIGLLWCAASAHADKPNVLFIIADYASRHFGNAYDCDWVKTPNIDRLASEGLVFENAYVPTSKCAPCRAAILTGRNPWQNGQAANHQNFLPARLRAFGDALQRSGVYTGSIGKVWGPGVANETDGAKREFGLPPVAKGNKVKAVPVGKEASARLGKGTAWSEQKESPKWPCSMRDT